MAVSGPTRQAYAVPGNAYYTMQAPQAAAAAFTAAMMQAVQNQPSVPQMPVVQQAPPTYLQQQLASSQAVPQQTLPQMPQQPSYGNQPAFASMSQLQAPAAPQWVVPQFQTPAAPPASLTEGMPDPVAVDRQKAGYLKTLEDQRQQYINALNGQRQEHLASIHGQAEQIRKQLLMKVEQQVKEQIVVLENQYSEQVLMLNQQFHQQRGTLEQEAIKLKGEYQQKQLEEQANQRQFQLQKERCEMEQKYAVDMQKLQHQQYQLNQQVAHQPSFSATSGQQCPPAQGTMWYNPPPVEATQGMGSYAPPPTMPVQQGSYVPAEPGMGSYVPPVTMMAQPGSYVPPVTSCVGSYVPPPSMAAAQGSYAPAPAQGSYVPPMQYVTQGSYVPPTVISHVVENYVVQEAVGSMAGSYVPPVVMQPQAPVYYGQSGGGMQVPPTRNNNVGTEPTFESMTYVSAPTVPIMSYN